MKKCLLLLILVIPALSMAGGLPMTDTNGYTYKNENTIRDKRKIAILSYGSLVNQSANLRTGAVLETTGFAPTDIQLPVSLSRISQDNRLTAVIDAQGELKRVYAAQSKFQSLPNARNNLAAREGARYLGQQDGYILDAIFYMKKILPGQVKDSNEDVIPNTLNWVIRHENSERQRLPINVAQSLARWADGRGFTGIIWASFAPNQGSQAEIIQKLLSDSALLRNTQEYVTKLPDGPQSAFERAVVGGINALRAFQNGTAVIAQTQQRQIIEREPSPQAQAAAAATSSTEQRAQRPRQELRAHEEVGLRYEHLTYFQKGDLPILLTAPHGGRKDVGIPKRVGTDRSGREIAQFCTAWDDGTLELTRRVSDTIYNLLGARPYVVIADFTRDDIDANRPGGAGAYEDLRAKPIYDFYHGKIRSYINDIKARFGNRAILLDIHGQGTDARGIYRGTRDRATVKRLIARDGEAAFTGENSILGLLLQKGNTIFPRNNDRSRENGHYSGGYTVGAYGSHNADGIDAIQLETGWDLRRANRNQAQFAQHLAEAIAGFYLNYLVQ